MKALPETLLAHSKTAAIAFVFVWFAVGGLGQAVAVDRRADELGPAAPGPVDAEPEVAEIERRLPKIYEIPFDSDRKLQTNAYYERSIWQLGGLEID